LWISGGHEFEPHREQSIILFFAPSTLVSDVNARGRKSNTGGRYVEGFPSLSAVKQKMVVSTCDQYFHSHYEVFHIPESSILGKATESMHTGKLSPAYVETL